MRNTLQAYPAPSAICMHTPATRIHHRFTPRIIPPSAPSQSAAVYSRSNGMAPLCSRWSESGKKESRREAREASAESKMRGAAGTAEGRPSESCVMADEGVLTANRERLQLLPERID